jgi:hypothetical protein
MAVAEYASQSALAQARARGATAPQAQHQSVWHRRPEPGLRVLYYLPVLDHRRDADHPGFIKARATVMMPESTNHIRELISQRRIQGADQYTETDPSFISKAAQSRSQAAPASPP